MNAIPPDCLKRWTRVISETKTLAAWPAWWEEPKPPKSKIERLPVVSLEAGRYILVVPLNDSSGITMEGARLRLHVPTRRLDIDMTATLECLDWNDYHRCIARLDANPTGAHTNRHWRDFKLPWRLDGTHLHPFELNARLGGSAFTSENMPIAEAWPHDIRNFREFLRSVGYAFNIADVGGLPPPPWNEGFQF